MILVDTALRRREAADDPIRVGVIGAGFMGRAVAKQIVNATPGMVLAAISNRRLEPAHRAFAEAGSPTPRVVESSRALEQAITDRVSAVTDDPSVLCGADGIDVILEVTGTIAFGAGVVVDAIEQGKHVVVLNAELDGTLGPLFKAYADDAGVIYTASDGDQQGVEGNLYRYVQGLGVTPLLMGNVKGLQDPYRNPTTQENFARKWGMSPYMVTSAADGTKMTFEQATVANAFGLSVLERGMTGIEHDGHVDELTEHFDVDRLRELGGVVDYVVGSRPAPGVFCLGTHDDPEHRRLLEYYKLGKGPLYSFYQPYHLCHFETPSSLARAVIFGDATLAPQGGPHVEVVATAKIPMGSGTTLDGLGGYLTYGEAETAAITAAERLLPIGVAEGCTLTRDVSRDQTLSYDDVELPPDRRVDRLRAEMGRRFGTQAVASSS